MFSPAFCFKQKRPKFIDLPFLDIYVDRKDRGLLENQYNKLKDID